MLLITGPPKIKNDISKKENGFLCAWSLNLKPICENLKAGKENFVGKEGKLRSLVEYILAIR